MRAAIAEIGRSKVGLYYYQMLYSSSSSRQYAEHSLIGGGLLVEADAEMCAISFYWIRQTSIWSLE